MSRTMTLCNLALICLAGSALAKPEERNPLADKSVPELASILSQSKDEALRLNASKALRAKMPQKSVRLRRGQKTPAYPKADADLVKALLRGLHDTSSGVRYECRKGLGCGGETALSGLLAEMASKEADARSYAADALGDMGTYPDAAGLPLDKALPALQKALSDKDYRVRVSAAMALSKIGARSAPALPQLIRLLDDEKWAVADAAVRAVGQADPSGVKSVPALVRVLDNKKHDLREFACNELKAMGAKAKAAIPALIKLLDADRESWYAGKGAADALMAMVSYDKRKIKDDPAADVRAGVISAIAQSVNNQAAPFVKLDRLQALFIPGNVACPMGEEVLPALPHALELLEKWMKKPPWGDPRGKLAAFLARVGGHAPEQVVPVVTRLLDDPEIKKDEKGTKLLQDLLNKLEAK